MSDDSEAEEADIEDVEEETDAEGLQRGDFIELDYTAYTVEGDQLVDTTDPEVAEEEGVDDEEQERAEALDAYRDSDLFRRTWSTVKPLFAERPRARSYTVARPADAIDAAARDATDPGQP